MISEKDFLARVSARLNRTQPPARPQWKPSLPLANYGPADAEALAERFTAELVKLSGKVYRAGSEAEVAQIVAAILQGAGVKGKVVRWEDPTLAGLNLDEALTAAGYHVVPFDGKQAGRILVKTAEQSVAGITGVDAAIAETGSLVMSSHRLNEEGAPGRGRVVGLLPPIHIAIVRKEQFVYSALSVFRKLAAGKMPPQVIFASGPSRSADIENDLSIGVHGPGQAHVVIV